MLTLPEIAALVNPWYGQGRIREGDYQTLKTQYLVEIGATPQGCTTCRSFRSDVLHHFRYKLRQHNIPIMKTTRKYILADEVQYLQLPDDPRLIVNEAGDDDENRRPLTDALAEQLFALDEAYKGFIVQNPAYEAPKATPAPAKSAPAAKPKATPAPAKSAPADVAAAVLAEDAAMAGTGSSLSELPLDQ